MVPPKSFQRSDGTLATPLTTFTLVALLAQLLAANALLRTNSYRSPWNVLVPLLVTTVTCAPPARPVSAVYKERSTLNSAMASTLGKVIRVRLLPRSTLSTPSTVQLLAELRFPFTEKGSVARSEEHTSELQSLR